MLAVITENQLDAWVRGNAREAQELVVNLVYRLVAASCPNPLERRFPLGDSIGQPGPDGILHVDSGYAPFVPDGRSYWEVGTGGKTGKEVQDKATSAYSSLTKALQENMQENIREDSTFVFVTPRSGVSAWQEQDQAAWLEKRRKTGEWKDVKVIDGTKLIDWLHHFPTVGTWLAGSIHGPQLDHIEIPERRWEELRTRGTPPQLTPDVFLANRGNACQKLQDALDGRTPKLKLVTRFPYHAVDFVCAYLASLDENRRVEVAGRCLIVSDLKAWDTVCNQYHGRNFILIADPSLHLSGEPGSRAISKAAAAGHVAVYDAPPGGTPDEFSVVLQAPRAHQIKDALIIAGHPEQRAHTLSDRCNRDLSALLRFLDGHSFPPEWATGSGGPDLASALLVGSWAHGSEADRAVIRKLADKEYRDWNNAINEIAGVRNPPLIRIDGLWKFVSRFEGWYALVDKLDEDHLDKFREIAVWVLRDNGPHFDPSPEELLQAARKGRTFTLSPHLCKGIAESLALIGGHSKAFPSHIRHIAIHTADRAVHEIFANADWETWASLDRLLPLLAEASPDEFLKAVREALDRTPCPFDQIFSLEVGGIFGRNYLTGLLWALETLAWEKRYLTEACLLLGRLVSRDPGGDWGNRPIDSLVRILLPWLPQTLASAQGRVKTIRVLSREESRAAWGLLLSLLPNTQDFTHTTHRPSWRETIPDDWEPDEPHTGEYWEQIEACAELTIEMACNDFERLKDENFIDQLHKLPQRLFDRTLDLLSSESVTSQPEEQRIELWIELTRFVRVQKQHPNASWSLNCQEVSRLENVVLSLFPTNQSAVHRMLFGREVSLLYEETDDWRESDQKRDTLRQQAMREILSLSGLDKVIELAEDVEYPDCVGHALASEANIETDEQLLPDMLDSRSEKLTAFAKGYVWSRRRRKGWKWVDGLKISNWTPAQIGKFLGWLPFSEEAWNRANACLNENEAEYWTRADARLPYDYEGEADLAIEKLIQYGRHQAAIECLGRILYKNKAINSSLACRALLSVNTPNHRSEQEFRHITIELIKALQSDPNTSPDSLLEIEWKHFDALDPLFGASPKTIEHCLTSDPTYFCRVIEIRYRFRSTVTFTEELSQHENDIREHAFSMLQYKWKTPPGTQPDGSFQPDALRRWLSEVKSLCTSSELLEEAYLRIGSVLFYCPQDPDGLLIHRTAAAALDEGDAKEMRRGYYFAITDSRGVYAVDGTGKQERDLAEQYRQKAEKIENAGYPYLAEVFREVAERYGDESDNAITRDAQMD